MAEYRDLKLDGRELDPSTTIWRYVKLSTLIYLLTERRSFIPKLITLQKEDPFEGRLIIYEGHQEAMCLNGELQKHEKWLRKKKTDGGTLADWETKDGMKPKLVHVWMREVARRRAVWCWHESHNECMGQWRIYGKEAGVAIRSDVGSVCQILSGEGKNRDVAFGRVRYLPPNQPCNLDDSTAADVARNPIFVKNTVFEHEKEVRFVLSDRPTEHPGYPIKTDPLMFVKEIVLSPFFLPSEGMAVIKAIKSLLKSLGVDDSKPISVKLSGARNTDEPDGQREASFGDVIYEHLADEWIANNSGNDSSDVPSILSLFPPNGRI